MAQRGRPAKGKEKRTQFIFCRVNLAEKTMFERLAQRTGVKPSTLLRQLALQHAQQDKEVTL